MRVRIETMVRPAGSREEKDGWRCNRVAGIGEESETRPAAACLMLSPERDGLEIPRVAGIGEESALRMS
jgi:hypothetical protein